MILINGKKLTKCKKQTKELFDSLGPRALVGQGLGRGMGESFLDAWASCKGISSGHRVHFMLLWICTIHTILYHTHYNVIWDPYVHLMALCIHTIPYGIQISTLWMQTYHSIPYDTIPPGHNTGSLSSVHTNSQDWKLLDSQASRPYGILFLRLFRFQRLHDSTIGYILSYSDSQTFSFLVSQIRC